MAVVEHVADDGFAGGDQAQGTRGRDAQVVHRLAAQEFADRGSQYRTTIGTARIGCRARTLELQLPTFAGGIDGLPQCDRAAVTKLTSPVAELMASVVCRIWLHFRQQRIAAENLCEFRRSDLRFIDAQRARHLA